MRGIARALVCVAAALVGASCLQEETKTCASGIVCPSSQACDEARDTCRAQEQADACLGLADGTACTTSTISMGGYCSVGFCLVAGCGNGQTEAGEICDDLNQESGDGCRSDCKSDETCGNGKIDAEVGEQCDDGNGTGNDACEATCMLPRCGDGVANFDSEQCDDGNVTPGDGCSATCVLEACGDGKVDLGEECDDGNVAGNDACEAGCRVPRCGDGVFNPVAGEGCEDANVEPGDGCDSLCRVEACGNERIDAGEMCDAGVAGNDLCRGDEPGEDLDCTLRTCGDGVVDVNRFEACDDGAANSNAADAACRMNCQPRRCGDGVLDGAAGEACDDGGNVAGDGCDGLCRIEACGNGVVDVGEQCDGGAAGSVLCRGADEVDAALRCTLRRCGDAIVDAALFEACDAGDGNSNAADAACRVNCQARRCGDGIPDALAGEACDDGGNSVGDGCDGSCQVEECGNGRVDSDEECDDGNTDDGDACRTTCVRPGCGDGITDAQLFEGCDDGDANSDGPDAACRLNCQPRRCGDNVVDTESDEACDDGGNVAGDGCDGLCRVEACGNGRADLGEECDGGAAGSALCRGSDEVDPALRCTLRRCGDGLIDASLFEACDAGAANSNAADAACRVTCQPRRCGDGIEDVVAGEQCDDANNAAGDGCDGSCHDEVCGNGRVDLGEDCDDGNGTDGDACRNDCSRPACGDGLVDAQLFEACDAGAANSNSPDATCRVTCQLRRCGDGVKDVNAGEQCDDTNNVSGDGCDGSCHLEVCGNGRVDGLESCDDGNGNDSDECRNNCTRPRCGDGIYDPQMYEGCDLGAANSNAPNAACRTTCQPARCGDGVADPNRGEVCDDGNNHSGDHCSADCTSNETCGNGLVDSLAGEACDDGDFDQTDGCRYCALPTCGDGVTDAVLGEECDDPAGNSNDGDALCRPECFLARCGDGITDVGNGELCDDGNPFYDDGCRPDCMSKEYCGDGVVDSYLGEECDDGAADKEAGCEDCKLRGECGNGSIENYETCDDGNHLNHDGCSSTCASEDATWTIAGVAEPGPLSGAQLSFDYQRERLVLTGGRDTDRNQVASVRTYVDGAWQAQRGESMRIKRADHAQAYDVERDQLVVCGGSGDGAPCETFDGQRWADVERHYDLDFDGAAMVWDDARHRLVLVGGRKRGSDFNKDVYVGHANSFESLNIRSESPAPRVFASLVYDPRRQVVVMLGGFDRDGKATRDIWELAGVRWRQVATDIDTRGHAVAYYNSVSRKVVVAGGSIDLDSPALDQVSTWDGTSWVAEAALASRPPARRAAAGTFDPIRKMATLLGGIGSDAQPAGDTWQLVGVTWSELTAAVLDPRTGPVLAHDWKRARTMLVGGADGAPTYFGDTYELGLDGWQIRRPAALSPDARWQAGSAYLASTSSIIMAGGRTESSTALAGSTAWNGDTWSSSSAMPDRRYAMALAASPTEILAFGGCDKSDRSHGETWSFDGFAWGTRGGAGPSPRGGAHLAYDPQEHGRFVLAGGMTCEDNKAIDEVWSYADDTWTFVGQLGFDVVGLTYDAALRRVLAFSADDVYVLEGASQHVLGAVLDALPDVRLIGPATYDPQRGVSRVWAEDRATRAGIVVEFQYAALGGQEECSLTVDADGDGRVGCADEDCWTTCRPTCPPGAVCEGVQAKCGDGVLEAPETCASCPDDDRTLSCIAPCGDLVCDDALESAVTCPVDCH